MHKKWYKIKCGLSADPVLGIAAKRAGLSKSESIAVYICLLDAENQREHLPDSEEIAFLLDIDIKRIDALLDAFCNKHLITQDGKIAGLPKRVSSATLRVRAMRARRKAETQIPPIKQNRTSHDTPAAIAARRARLTPQKTTP